MLHPIRYIPIPSPRGILLTSLVGILISETEPSGFTWLVLIVDEPVVLMHTHAVYRKHVNMWSHYDWAIPILVKCDGQNTNRYPWMTGMHTQKPWTHLLISINTDTNKHRVNTNIPFCNAILLLKVLFRVLKSSRYVIYWNVIYLILLCSIWYVWK